MRRRWIATLSSLGIAAAQGAAATSLFLPLGDLAGGNFDSVASDISADGGTVVGSGRNDGGGEGVVWTVSNGQVTSMQALGAPPQEPSTSSAVAVSGDGSVAVGFDLDPNQTPFIWTASTGRQFLGDLPGGQNSGAAYAISADGSVIAGRGNSSLGQEAFRWTAATGMQGLGSVSVAHGISGDGGTIVGERFGSEAFVWTAANGMQGLGDLPGGIFSSIAYDASFDGSRIVGRGTTESAEGNSIYEAFIWDAANGMRGLGHLPGGDFGSSAYAVSADGSVVVGASDVDINDPGPVAWVWDEQFGMRALIDVLILNGIDMTGWHLITALGIADDGRTIVGYGINPQGNTEAYYAVIPEPSTGWLLAFGLFAVAVRARPRR